MDTRSPLSHAGETGNPFRPIILVLLLLASFAMGCSNAIADSSDFRKRIVTLYDFKAATLSSAEIDAKSDELDKFWKSVKENPDATLPFLRAELKRPGNPPFFYFDGSKLLLSLSTTEADRLIALSAIPRVDIAHIQPTEYLRTIHWFAYKGFDTTQAAMRVLDYPKYRAFIAQHALTLNQDFSLIFMLFQMDEQRFLPALIKRLDRAKDPVSQKSLLQAIWYVVSADGNRKIAQFANDTRNPAVSRDYAKKLLQRRGTASGRADISYRPDIRAERRKVMRRLSDEALYEFDNLTRKLLPSTSSL